MTSDSKDEATSTIRVQRGRDGNFLPFRVKRGKEYRVIVPRAAAGRVFRLDHYYPGQRVFLPRAITSAADGSLDSLDILADYLAALQPESSEVQVLCAHSDASGSSGRNLEITQARAASLRGFLVGDPERWSAVLVDDDHDVAPRVLWAWVADRFGWDVDTTGESGWGPRCEAALKTYRTNLADVLGQTPGNGPRMDSADWLAGYALMRKASLGRLSRSISRRRRVTTRT